MPKIEKHQDGVAPQGCFVPEMALTVRPIEVRIPMMPPCHSEIMPPSIPG
jgi:hypothetical protein